MPAQRSVLELVKEEIDGSNLAVTGDYEIGSGVLWRAARATLHPPDPAAIAHLLRRGERWILKVRMSGLDHALRCGRFRRGGGKRRLVRRTRRLRGLRLAYGSRSRVRLLISTLAGRRRQEELSQTAATQPPGSAALCHRTHIDRSMPICDAACWSTAIGSSL